MDGRTGTPSACRLLLAIPLSAAATALTAEPLPHRIAPILTHTHPSHYRHEQECGQNAGGRRRSHPRPRCLRHDSMFVAQMASEGHATDDANAASDKEHTDWRICLLLLLAVCAAFRAVRHYVRATGDELLSTPLDVRQHARRTELRTGRGGSGRGRVCLHWHGAALHSHGRMPRR